MHNFLVSFVNHFDWPLFCVLSLLLYAYIRKYLINLVSFNILPSTLKLPSNPLNWKIVNEYPFLTIAIPKKKRNIYIYWENASSTIKNHKLHWLYYDKIIKEAHFTPFRFRFHMTTLKKYVLMQHIEIVWLIIQK